MASCRHPLSCHLFNCVIDLALSNLDNEVGIHIWNSFLNDMAFADDMCLLATTPAGLQRNLDLLHNSLRASGMEISTGVGGKSASLRIDIDGKAKRWVVNPNSYLTVGEGLIPALSITQCYKYLGILTRALGVRTQLRDTLQGWLDNITRAH